MDLELVKRTGVGAAYKGAEVLMAKFGNLSRIDKKGAIDLVTEADTASEERIIETLRSRFPDHAVLAEESGGRSGAGDNGSDPQWIIDPLDGTTNFAHGLALFCTSIAFAVDGEVRVGVILNPVSGELFTAVKGEGAALNGHPIRVSETAAVSESLLVTGFPYNFKTIFQDVMARFGNCLKAGRGIRRLGSAALDLCFVACGRFEGFWEQNLHPWDTAAGFLMVEEAGGAVTDFGGTPFAIEGKEILATNGKIHDEMLSLLEIRDSE